MKPIRRLLIGGILFFVLTCGSGLAPLTRPAGTAPPQRASLCSVAWVTEQRPDGLVLGIKLDCARLRLTVIDRKF
jgi:hypothetical protein